MRRPVRTLISFAAALTLAACSGNTSPGGPMGDAPAPDAGSGGLPDTLSIPEGAMRAADGGRVSIHFVTRVSDSRCAANVVCVWEGDASVRLRISAGSAFADTVLHTRTEPTSFAIGDYLITVSGLIPYPGTYPADGPEPSPTALVAVERN